MQYTVTLTQQANGSFLASVPIFPHINRRGGNREEVLESVRQALTETLMTTEFITIDVPTLQNKNPWLDTAGMFADDKELLPMLDMIYANRNAA